MPKFAENDPLHDLHVPWYKRRWSDQGPGSNALTDEGDGKVDREAIREDTTVVSEEDLQ